MAKRYIIRCPVCGLLDHVNRRDAVTCSVKCRVWLHRHPGHLDSLRATCDLMKVDVFDVLEADAMRLLRPDLSDRIISGELELEEVRDDVARAFWDIVLREAAI